MQKTPTLGWTFEVFTFTADYKLNFTDSKLDFDEALKICNMLMFLVGSKKAFEISLADVSQTQLQGKK
ncbi:hypothetical protein LguiB_033252 [Lonicera macranthoides]